MGRLFDKHGIKAEVGKPIYLEHDRAPLRTLSPMYIYYMVDTCNCPEHKGRDWGFLLESEKDLILDDFKQRGQDRPSECCWMVPGTVSPND